MSERASANHCPYCGDVDLRPHLAAGAEESVPGTWECRSCLRAFKLTMLGMINPPGATA